MMIVGSDAVVERDHPRLLPQTNPVNNSTTSRIAAEAAARNRDFVQANVALAKMSNVAQTISFMIATPSFNPEPPARRDKAFHRRWLRALRQSHASESAIHVGRVQSLRAIAP